MVTPNRLKDPIPKYRFVFSIRMCEGILQLIGKHFPDQDFIHFTLSTTKHILTLSTAEPTYRYIVFDIFSAIVELKLAPSVLILLLFYLSCNTDLS